MKVSSMSRKFSIKVRHSGFMMYAERPALVLPGADAFRMPECIAFVMFFSFSPEAFLPKRKYFTLFLFYVSRGTAEFTIAELGWSRRSRQPCFAHCHEDVGNLLFASVGDDAEPNGTDLTPFKFMRSHHAKMLSGMKQLARTCPFTTVEETRIERPVNILKFSSHCLRSDRLISPVSAWNDSTTRPFGE